MSKKNKNSSKSAERATEVGEEGSVQAEPGEPSDKVEDTAPKPVKTRKPRSPLGPLPVRLCEKADKVYAMVAEMAKQTASRGAPEAVCSVASAFLAQVETWRDVFYGLKTSGWVPSASVAKDAIKEGDLIRILPEHEGRYSFIDGLADGTVKLVAGSVDQVNKMIVQVMLKGEDGKFYGYCPRQYLTRR
jgi:hypothetical protein